MGLLEGLYARAEALERLGRRDEALVEYDDLVAARLGDADTLMRRAAVLRGLRRLHEAEGDYRRAAEVEPWNGWPLLRHAEMLRDAGRPWLAAAAVERAIGRQPEMEEMRVHDAVIFASLDWLDRAFGTIRGVSAERGDWWGDARRTAEADHRRARAEARAALSPPRAPGVELAAALLRVGRTRAARRLCEAAMRERPREFAAFGLCARIVAREDGLEEAVAFLRAVAFLHRGDPDYEAVLHDMDAQRRL